eukprot:7587728-Pyramimonas_sp.AAC.1
MGSIRHHKDGKGFTVDDKGYEVDSKGYVAYSVGSPRRNIQGKTWLVRGTPRGSLWTIRDS